MSPGRRALTWAAAALAVAAAVALDLGALLSLELLQSQREALVAAYQARPVQTLALFFGLYVATVALSIPSAAVLTLAAGAIFGLGTGVLVVSFASSLGALLAFLVARHLLRDLVQSRFGRLLEPINEGVRRDGAAYLLSLRLAPLFPVWLINLSMALTPMGAGRFYAVSQLGMLPGTVVYVNAGTQLAMLHSLRDILSPAVLASLLLLAAFPLLAKAVIGGVQRRRLRAGWTRPRRFDRNLVVIGAGAGGLVTSWVAAAARARVTLVEGHRMGGDCLNTGCVPSKALLHSAKAAHALRRAAPLGLGGVQAEVDFAAVMRRVREVIRDIEPHDSVERYTALGVEVLQGQARLLSPWSVEVLGADGNRQVLATRSIVIATGAAPTVPAIPGLAQAGFLTSDTVWGLQALPRRLLVLGGGPVGCELAQAFARLGSRVTLVERAPRLLMREDAEAAALVAASLREDGVALCLDHEALRVETAGGSRQLVVGRGGREHALPFDEILCAAGRTPRTAGLGLEALGIALTPEGRIATNPWLQTRWPHIYAVGDVAGPWQLTHAASHQGANAALSALFGRWRRFRADTPVMPRAIFTDPEVASVGLTEDEATRQGVRFELTRHDLADLDRAIADGCAQGFVKVLTAQGSDRILGVTIVAARAGEMLAEYALAMRHGLGLNMILATVHAYPTYSEANRHAAGQWRRARTPKWLMAWLERYHAWERG